MAPATGDPRSAFERRLASEILSAERFRATLLAVLPTVVELNRLGVGGFLAIALVIACVLPAVLGVYTVFAARARSRLSRPGTVRWVQRGTGAVMAGAAIAVATR